MKFLEALNISQTQGIVNLGILALTCLLVFSWLYLSRILLRWSAKSFTKLDDILIYALKLPVFLLILVSGIYSIVANLAYYVVDFTIPGLNDLVPYILSGFLFWISWRGINEFERLAVENQEQVLPKRLQSRVKLSRHSARLLVFSLRITISLVMIFTAINMAGVSLGGLLAFGGLGGIVLGFALKDPLSNFIAGALIFWERPFAVGDWIRCPAENIEGVVENITWRTTLIKTFERRPIYVPNSVFMNNTVENAERMTNRRIYEKLSVRYDDLTKLDGLLQDIREMIKQHEGIDDSQALIVAFDRYGDSALEFFVCAITYTKTWAGFQEVKEDILFKIGKLVEQHKAEFAYPTNRVMLDNPPTS